MKLICLSDTHLLAHNPVSRIDDAKQTQFEKWNFILQYAKDTNSTILEAGDFFNANRSWYLLPEVMDMLKKYQIEIFTIFGQHDTYLYSERTRAATSLGILEKAGLVEIADENLYERKKDGSVINIYGASYGQDIPEIKNEGTFNILIIHAPIAEKALYPNQKYMDALTFLKENHFDLIIAGDIHQKFIKEYGGRYIVNSGPLIRKEATLYNFQHKPGFWVYDTNKSTPPEFIEVPHKPADEVLSRTHIDSEKESSRVLDEFISSISNSKVEEGVDFISNLWAFAKTNNIPKDVTDLLAEVINDGIK